MTDETRILSPNSFCVLLQKVDISIFHKIKHVLSIYNDLTIDEDAIIYIEHIKSL